MSARPAKRLPPAGPLPDNWNVVRFPTPEERKLDHNQRVRAALIGMDRAWDSLTASPAFLDGIPNGDRLRPLNSIDDLLDDMWEAAKARNLIT